MQIQRTASSEERKWASNAESPQLLDNNSYSNVRDHVRSQTHSVIIDVFDCPDPNRGTGRYDYEVNLTTQEIIEFLIKSNPAAISSAVETILHGQANLDAGARIPEIIRQLVHGLYAAARANKLG